VVTLDGKGKGSYFGGTKEKPPEQLRGILRRGGVASQCQRGELACPYWKKSEERGGEEKNGKPQSLIKGGAKGSPTVPREEARPWIRKVGGRDPWGGWVGEDVQ